MSSWEGRLLLEIGTEEMPAGFIPRALEELDTRARKLLQEQGLGYEDVTTLGTPRRLILHASGVAERQPDREETVIGPPEKVAFDQEGSPTKAAKGFAAKNGCPVEAVEVVETPRGRYAAVVKRITGLPAVEVLAQALPSLVTSLPFPKSMRWGSHDVTFGRPIRWLVALLEDQTVPFEIAGVKSGSRSRGHRFMSKGWVEATSDLSVYLERLRENGVVASMQERMELVEQGAREAAAAAGGRLLEDGELVELNANLTEWPVAVCGSFEPRFLEVPREVLITAMKEHQKYFAVEDGEGGLMPNFVAINNIEPRDGSKIVKGHERVLRARLSDAAFFFETDKKRPLESFVQELSGMVFHAKLGSLLDKTQRVKRLAVHLASILAPEAKEHSERAALLAKADLLTEMVGEFPTLQGIMGMHYARLSGEPEEVCRAIAEHYMPVRAGSELPSTVSGTICAIADKMDTICATFAIGLQPSGTQDPYGLRRAALGILHILLDKEISLDLAGLAYQALSLVAEALPELDRASVATEVMGFFRRRFTYDLQSRGFSGPAVEAAASARFDDPLDCMRRVEALSKVKASPDFEPLSIAFKRVMNILKKFDGEPELREELLAEKEEQGLYSAYRELEDEVSSLCDRGEYEAALSRLLALKGPVDAFFDSVLVMAEEQELRRNRLSLLWHISRLFLRIGDLSHMAAE